jgi:dTDP-4-dehydrorhamnose 3,5-epimerase
MKVSPVPRIVGALLFQPVPHTDERGFFSRTFDAQAARDAGLDPASFVQDSQSRSVRGVVVRGLHVRGGAGEAKLVRCSYGAVFDVIVDLRADSPTYLNWESFELCDTEQVSLYVPAGCAHGFQARTEPADVSYRIDRPHDPAEDISIAFDETNALDDQRACRFSSTPLKSVALLEFVEVHPHLIWQLEFCLVVVR